MKTETPLMKQVKGEILHKIPDSSRYNIVCIEVVYKSKLCSYFAHTQHIASTNPNKVRGRATGFFIAPSLLVTNMNVIVSAKSVTIKQFDVKKSKEPILYAIEGVLAFDAMNDLVVLKVTQQCDNFIPIGNSNTVKQEDRVLSFTYSEEKYYSIENTINFCSTHDGCYRINTRLSLGSSGAPILNLNGEVIGIANSMNLIKSDTIDATNFTYVIPSNTLINIIEKSEKVVPVVAWLKHTDIRAYVEDIFANINLQKGDYYSALGKFDTALQLNPNLVKAYVNRGFTKLMLNDYEGAISDCDEAIRLNPGLVQAYTNRIAAKNNFQDFEGTLSDLDTLLLHFQDSVELYQFYFLRASVNDILCNSEEAIDDYTQAMELNPRDPRTYYNRGRIRTILGQNNTDQGNVDEAYNLYIAALEDYNIALQLTPDRNIINFSLGIVKYKLGNSLVRKENLDDAQSYYQQAIADYNVYLNRSYWSSKAYYNRGIAKFQLGKIELKRGNAECAKRYYQDTIIDLDKSIYENRNYVKAYYQRGNVKKTLGQNKAAIKDYTKTIQLDPKHVDAYYNRGYIIENLAESKVESGNLDNAQTLYLDALEDYNTAIQLAPEKSYFYIRRGVVKRRLGSILVEQGNVEEAQKYYQEAITDYSEVIKQYPKYAVAYNNRGNAKFYLGLSESDIGNEEKAREYYNDAIIDLDKTIELDPKYVKAYKNRGKLKLALNIPDEAEADFAKAKELEVSD